MFYLIIAITFGSLFAILFKLFQRNGIDSLQAIGINYLVALSLSLAGNITINEPLVAISSWIFPALLAGFFMMGGFIMMNKATGSHGVAIATISARISFILPVLCAYIFLQENSPRWGTLALIITSLLLIFFNRQDKGRAKSWQWLYPMAVFICYGMANFLLKLCQQFVSKADGGNADLSMVTSVTFFAAFIYTAIYYATQPRQRRQSLAWKNVWAGIILGSANVGCTYFLLKSLMVMESGIFYPVYNIAIVLIATLIGRLYFKEKLSQIQYCGIIIALISIVLFFLY